MTYKELEDKIFNYPTKYEQGFIPEEVKNLVNELGLNEAEFSEALGVNTAIVVDGNVVTFYSDVLNAAHKLIKGTHLFWD